MAKEMATHSSIFAWKIPWTEEPGRLQSMGVSRVNHDLATKPPPPIYLYLYLISSISMENPEIYHCKSFGNI